MTYSRALKSLLKKLNKAPSNVLKDFSKNPLFKSSVRNKALAILKKRKRR